MISDEELDRLAKLGVELKQLEAVGADECDLGEQRRVAAKQRFKAKLLQYGERLISQAREANNLRGFISQSLPFLEEAWNACFDGKEQKLLSCEQRGMREIILKFREIAAGKPALPPGCITIAEASRMAETAIAWAHRTLGSPNELHPDLKRWMMCGETCADGIRRANAEVERLRAWAQSITLEPLDPFNAPESRIHRALSFARQHGYHETDAAFTELHGMRANNASLSAEVERLRGTTR